MESYTVYADTSHNLQPANEAMSLQADRWNRAHSPRTFLVGLHQQLGGQHQRSPAPALLQR